MIFAFTGQPGAGKTIGAIEFVYKDAQFENRQVYVYGVKGLNVEGWIEITKEQVLEWWKLPEGSVLIIDECQDIWRPRKQGVSVPEHVQQLEKHRHLGFDFVLTFQFPTQIDTVVRNLITDHHHSHRAMGLDGRTVYKYDGLCLNPLSKGNVKAAVVSRKKFNKEIYDLYESASLHTVKKRIPWYVFLLPIVAIIAIILIYFSYTRLMDNFDNSDLQLPNQNQHAQSSNNDDDIEPEFSRSTEDDYLKNRIPRIKNQPRSRPIYDSLNVARTLPKSFCLSSSSYNKRRGSCRCYTQQATWQRSIDEKQCHEYIKNGYEFDYTEEPEDREMEPDAASSGAPFALTEPPVAKIRPVRYSDKVDYPQ